MLMTREWLEHHQIPIYFVAIAAAAAAGLSFEGIPARAEGLVTPAIAVLMYAMFLQIPFLSLRAAMTNRSFLGALLLSNFVLVPLLVWALTLPLSDHRALMIGALLVLLTPCIDYVVAFTHLAKGDSRLVLSATPVLLLLQFALLPLYLRWMLGGEVGVSLSAAPFIEAFLLLIAAPLLLAVITEAASARLQTVRVWKDGWAWLPVPAMAAVLIVVVASQIANVAGDAGVLMRLLPVYTAFLILAPVIGALAARLFNLDAPTARAVAFSSATRNSLVILPLALALPADVRLLAASAVIVQTIVELLGELIYIRAIPALVRRTQPPGDT
jgi:ACR3 family arsenite efflux pump ArsB